MERLQREYGNESMTQVPWTTIVGPRCHGSSAQAEALGAQINDLPSQGPIGLGIPPKGNLHGHGCRNFANSMCSELHVVIKRLRQRALNGMAKPAWCLESLEIQHNPSHGIFV